MKIIYCDGSSLGNPGPGGWGVVAIDTTREKYWQFGGAEKNTTNNRMEIKALMAALQIILNSKNKSAEKIELRLDSQYVINGATIWYKNWIKNSWKNAAKKEVMNRDLWEQVVQMLAMLEDKKIKINFKYVPGHSGEYWNDMTDSVAKSFASGHETKTGVAKNITHAV